MTRSRHQAADDESTARRSRGRPAVPPDRIVDAALAIVDEHGVEALSMRKLAHRLNSGTATLYRHFPHRASLIARVVDRVFGEVELDAAELTATTWHQAFQTVGETLFDAFRRHPNVAPLWIGQLPIGPHMMALRERCLAMLLHNGFPPALAIRSYATLIRYVLGFAVQLSGTDEASGDDDEQVIAMFRDADPTLYPATASVAAAVPVPLEEEFTFGLQLLLSGLAETSRQ